MQQALEWGRWKARRSGRRLFHWGQEYTGKQRHIIASQSLPAPEKSESSTCQVWHQIQNIQEQKLRSLPQSSWKAVC